MSNQTLNSVFSHFKLQKTNNFHQSVHEKSISSNSTEKALNGPKQRFSSTTKCFMQIWCSLHRKSTTWQKSMVKTTHCKWNTSGLFHYFYINYLLQLTVDVPILFIYDQIRLYELYVDIILFYYVNKYNSYDNTTNTYHNR